MLAIENFQYTSRLLGLGEQPTLEDFATAGYFRFSCTFP